MLAQIAYMIYVVLCTCKDLLNIHNQILKKHENYIRTYWIHRYYIFTDLQIHEEVKTDVHDTQEV